ncbi:MAG: AAA family ATPase [Sulfurospirillum sp.]
MIERLCLKEHFSFGSCELNFKEGLVAFTGPSGAGKSVLMQALLSLFGYGDASASLIEANIAKHMDMDDFGVQSEEVNIFKLVKSKTSRYFINSQNISKKNINEISKKLINYLSVKDSSEFDNERLLELVDAISSQNNPLYVEFLELFKKSYTQYKKLDEKLSVLLEKERKIEELKDFARFEIARIEEVSPKIGEDEELQIQKKILSKKEKIGTALETAMQIFRAESSVIEALNLMDEESSFFDECMNELRAKFEIQQARLDELEDIDVESLLERIEKIAGLKKRYGDIEEILLYKQKKISELKEYENITFTKDELEKSYIKVKAETQELANKISKIRIQNLSNMNNYINSYLKELYMPDVKLYIVQKDLDEFGLDKIEVNLGSVELKKISSGEYNRLRLAFLATRQEYLQSDGGVLILDEIDSNLSGKESMSVANVLLKLSKKYQIFAISHQPQLSSRADMHFLVEKNGDKSSVRVLNQKQRIEELARMVSGEEIHDKAIEFAKSLME